MTKELQVRSSKKMLRVLRLLEVLATPLAMVGLSFHPKGRALIRGRWRARRELLHQLQSIPKGGSWIHVASAGELEQAIPILEMRKARGDAILLTFFSPSTQGALERERHRRDLRGEMPPWDLASYLPWGKTARVMEAFAPQTLLLFRGELWPALLHEAQRTGVSVFLLGAFLTRAKARYLAPLFRSLQGIGTVDAPSATFLQGLGGPRVEWVGDPRWVRVCQRAATVRSPRLGGAPWVVLGSVWEEDLQILFRENFSRKPWGWIVVFHELHPKTLQKWQRRLAPYFCSVVVAKEVPSLLKPGTCVLLEKMGALFDLYAGASCAFVGGSFARKVHNVLEPAAYGLPIVTGPQIHNSPEALLLRRAGWLTVVENGTQFGPLLERLRRPQEEPFCPPQEILRRCQALLEGSEIS